MGSMWCKPSQFTDDCSPKLNIHSILTRLSSQICPSRCRYSHSGSRSHTKQRPRNEAVSKGCRPVISHPLMQPVPPPRKKRKHIQDLSRSEEHLCSSDIPTSTPLRAANSLPVLCVPISQLKTKQNQEPLESITEEAMPSIMREMEDMESLPISEVYFLRKDGNTSAPVFDAIPKDVADKTMTLEISGITNMANSNFLDRSNTCGQVRIDTEVIERITDKRKEIIETETITRVIDKKSVAGSNSSVGDHIQRSEKTRIIDKKSDGTNLIAGDNIQRSEPKQKNDDVGGTVVTVNNVVTKTDDVNSCDEVSNDVVDSVDTLEGKKRQDAMKSKWLQNILIGSDATENHRGNNSIPSFIPKDLREGVKNEQNASQNLNEAQEIQNANNSRLVEGPDDRVSKLIVTPECLNETLQRLNTSKANRDELLNNRNLVFNSQNSNLKVNESLTTMGKESNSSNWLTVEGQNVDKNDSSKNSDISGSRKSSRRSSITDSLQEFESSIYEMLQESAKANASDEDDSFIALHKQTLDSRQGTL